MDSIVDYNIDMFDSFSHLNPSGARKVTDYLVKYRQIIILWQITKTILPLPRNGTKNTQNMTNINSLILICARKIQTCS